MIQRVLIPLTLCAAACGAPSDLTPEAVRDVPDGDATGAPLAGDYDVELRVVDCQGACGPFQVGIFTTSLCDVGDTDEDTVAVRQVDGHLEIDTGDLPSRFEGGAYSDGSFEVGGYATQLGGELQITARSVGQIDAGGRLEATVTSRSWGQFDGQSADCIGVREVIGTRR